MSIIAISGRIGSGKDEVGKIINKLTNNKWEIKKFADSLKDTVCLLLGCTREDLESHDFKNSLVSEEWRVHYVKVEDAVNPIEKETKRVSKYYVSEESVKKEWFKGKKANSPFEIVSELFTVRKFLQVLGTECVRDHFHGNTWVNALFSKYKAKHHSVNYGTTSDKQRIAISTNQVYPYWIITDMRFPNEMQAVKDKGGITIRVNRPNLIENNHPSETSFDSATFDFVINNDKDIEHLINEVRKILEKLSII